MLRFAVAGAPLGTPTPSGTVEGLQYARKIGIGAMEIEWVQNVPGSTERMREIRSTADMLAMTLTTHAPYFVNFNAADKEKRLASIGRVNRALSMSELAGSTSVCVHAAFNLGMEPDAVYENVRCAVEEIMEKKKRFFPHVNLALETMGKPTQFGTLEEVLKISREFDIYPCVDFAHLHARTQGLLNTAAEWEHLLDQYETALGKTSLRCMHIHYSGIAFGPGGERKHLPLTQSDAHWRELLAVLKRRKVGGTLVCESPAMEEDVLLLQKTYSNL